MEKVSVEDLLNGNGDEILVWDNQPGGRVVKRWQENGVKYVGVEFENSPGEVYTYLQGSRK